MGHEIKYSTYDENVSKKKVQAHWDDYVSKVCWEEGSGGLGSNIRWLDFICKDYDSAIEYIRQHDNGFYDQLAVKYREYPQATPTKAYVTLCEKREAEMRKLMAYTEAHSIKTFKSNYIGCSKCGSKLNREYLHSEKCPLCGTDLRGNTTLETIKKYQTNIKELDKKIELELKKLNEKNISKSKVMWLVKIEYHV